MSEGTEETKKGGFFGKLMKIAFIAAIVAAVVAVFKRRRGKDLDEDEWQELPPARGRVAEPTTFRRGPALVAGPSRCGHVVRRARVAPGGWVDSGAVERDPWELAFEAARAAGVELRPLAELEDADRILRVMNATWAGPEPFPREVLRALADSGNVPFGAFDGDETIGYVLGWAGVDPEDGLHTHSHMLAALPDRRHRGVGYALKLAQRAQALDQGIAEVRWTFDPLVARNGYFNLSKLGAVADRFDRNHYGAMVDEVNAGERSDRFTVRWDLEREPGPREVGAHEAALEDADGWPGEVRAPSGTGGARRGSERLRADPDRRCRVRLGVARRLGARRSRPASTAGMIAAGFDRGLLELRVRARRGRAPVTRVRSIELRLVAIPLVRPFRTSFGESTEKVCILARVETDDAFGWGECVSDVEPNFSEEWNDGAWLMIRDFLAPALFAAGDVEASRVASVLLVRPRAPDGQGHARERGARRGAPGAGPLARLLPGRGPRPRRVRRLGRDRPVDRDAAGAGGGLPRRGVPAHQAQDRTGHRRRTRPRGPRGEPGDPALGGRERRLPPRRRRRVPAARCVRAADGRAAAAPRGPVSSTRCSNARSGPTSVSTSRSVRPRTPERRSSSARAGS